MEINIREERVDIHQGLENLRLAHLSDIHLWFNSNLVKKIERCIDDIEPELIVMTGDYFDTPWGALAFKKFIEKLALKFKVLFITGNHDKYYGKYFYDLIVNVSGVHCLDANDFVYTSRSNHNYQFVSLDSKNTHSEISSSRILLIHNPEILDGMDIEGIQLILAGHLHGGQFVFFKEKSSKTFPACIFYKYCVDRLKIGDTELIVSKGISDTFPFRFNCPREIILLTIS